MRVRIPSNAIFSLGPTPPPFSTGGQTDRIPREWSPIPLSMVFCQAIKSGTLDKRLVSTRDKSPSLCVYAATWSICGQLKTDKNQFPAKFGLAKRPPWHAVSLPVSSPLGNQLPDRGARQAAGMACKTRANINAPAPPRRLIRQVDAATGDSDVLCYGILAARAKPPLLKPYCHVALGSRKLLIMQVSIAGP